MMMMMMMMGGQNGIPVYARWIMPIRSMVKKTTHRRLWERHLRSLAARTERSHCKISRTWQLAACEISRNVTTCIGISYPSSLEEVEQSSPLTVLVLFVFIFLFIFFSHKSWERDGKPQSSWGGDPPNVVRNLANSWMKRWAWRGKGGNSKYFTDKGVKQCLNMHKLCLNCGSQSQLAENSTLTRLPSWRLTHWHLIWKQTKISIWKCVFEKVKSTNWKLSKFEVEMSKKRRKKPFLLKFSFFW